ncbi:hypothetical protein BABINDRAFT_67025 [Babjeviella inositovora NRRL Y-12698]|uniref:Major facilitator superfamily (MFS) profile domain-containing protein n=1 Tax=Babjeviella inositovora NRRL Y-12698 TaxID=984486 RepID=A0A1E3QJ59_9ASCO|nr:uncharacterized protein BABINDRAFT_67025 [Babjeviella inositovora NRRL Y-12698]ODQ77719.1 hypothetical protein BABINDRAFT_67025 [Babjeviella inositovora NRRL Y-12698]
MSLFNKFRSSTNPDGSKKQFRWRVSTSNDPPEIYNWTLYMSVLIFGILGSARGYDEGCISGTKTQKSFIHQFGLKDPTKTEDELATLKSNITSMVQLGSIGGSLMAIYFVDRFGRIRTLQGVCAFWVVAAIIQITSKTVGQLYAGRLLEGFSIGQTVVCGPTYLSEVAPKSIRGLCTCIFAGTVYFGIMLAYFANYGTALHVSNTSNLQWIAPTSIKIVLAGLLFIGSVFFCIESPRWLIKVGKHEQAVKNLSKIRNLPVDHPYILSEIADVNEQVQQLEKASESHSMWNILVEFFTIKSLRYRLFLGIGIQILGQWSGANAITIYAPEFFAMVGKAKSTDQLMMTAILGVVKLTSAYLCAFFVVDFLGRRKSLYIGITIQLVSTLYFAIYLTLVPQAAEDHVDLTLSQKAAGRGAMAMIYMSGVGWTMGWNSIQYLINSEIFPLRSRNIATSVIMVFHFANQYANSKATPHMLLAMSNYGAFYFFFTVLAIGISWCWFFVPEVAGRSLESMEELFNLPWYLIGRRGAKLCPDHTEITRVHYHGEKEGAARISISDKGEVTHFEGADSDSIDQESFHSKHSGDVHV